MAYCDSVRLVLDEKAELFLDDDGVSSSACVKLLRRACQIAHATGWREPESVELKSIIASLTQRGFDEKDATGYLHISALNLDYGVTDPADIGIQAESLALSDELDPHGSQYLWKLAARA